MIDTHDILETINMIDNENLDVRTITMGISLLDCADSDIDRACEKVYNSLLFICFLYILTNPFSSIFSLRCHG